MKKKTLAKVIPALTARTQLGQILRRVKRNRERFVVDKRGEPQAVILSVEDYLQHFAKRPDFLAESQRKARSARRDRISLKEISLEIAGYRKSRRKTRV